jgi:hypothetical protein
LSAEEGRRSTPQASISSSSARALAEADPTRFLPDLATSLNNQRKVMVPKRSYGDARGGSSPSGPRDEDAATSVMLFGQRYLERTGAPTPCRSQNDAIAGVSCERSNKDTETECRRVLRHQGASSGFGASRGP